MVAQRTGCWQVSPKGLDGTGATTRLERSQAAGRIGARPDVRLSAALVAILATFAAAATVRSEDLPTSSLPELTIDQLLEVPLVSVASKRPQSVQDAPSVVTVISSEEIQRQGYRTLADALRTLPGLYVSDDRNYSYVGVRGLGRPGDYNTRILLLVDGLRLNDNIYDGAYVERVMPIDMSMIERIEVSRGPGAAVYGDNAFFGVINVVTKRGSQMAGGDLHAGASSFGTYEGQVGYGRRLGDGADFVASASAFGSDGQTLRFPEFAETNNGIVRGGDGEASRKAFASFSKAGFFVEALHSSREKHIPTASYDTAFGDTRAVTRDSYTAASVAYERSLGARFDWNSRIAFEAYDYVGTYPYELSDGTASVEDDHAHGRWWTAESTGVMRAGPHTLMIGGEIKRNVRQNQGGGAPDMPETLFEIEDHGVRYGAFVQDDISLGKRVRLSLGGRYDHHEDFGGEANPRLGLIFTPRRDTTLKLLYGSSYRAPNEYEQNYYAIQGAHPELEPESIRTYEVVVGRDFGDHLRLTASAFSSGIRDLITLQSDAAGDLFFQNTDRARSIGAEAALDLGFGSGFAGRVNYSYQRTRDGESHPMSNSPSHMLKANLRLPLWRRNAWGSLDAQYVSSRLTLADRQDSGFVLVNATLLATHLKGGLEASASVYNVLDTRYADPGSEEHRQDTIPQNGRSFALKLGWRF